MGKIFCLMGKSSSGKDTIFKQLIEDKSLNLSPVISYTTRPIRHNENHGVEYYFINEKMLEKYIQTGKLIEKREYNTINGKWTYCTVDDGQIDLKKPIFYLLIVTLEAYRSLRNYFGTDSIVPFYIDVDDGTRLERALRRERKQQRPNYDEVCRRFLADNIDFEVAKLESCGITKRYQNFKLYECMRNVKADIVKTISQPSATEQNN